ncbi:MAG: serine hydrolase domain-containing protein [Actinomycetota bacterium]
MSKIETSGRLGKLRDKLAELAPPLEVPGTAVGIYHEGAEEYAFHGVTSLENPLEVDENTLFQFGSTGKTYTATAILRLVEQGVVDLDEAVRSYIPELKLEDEKAAQEVRVLNLLNHTAGWEGDFDVDTGQGDDALAKFVEKLQEANQEFPPGTSFSYNNAALSLAGRVIEKVTENTYEAAMKELVLDPLGLEQTFLVASDVMTRRFVVGHTNRPDGSIIVARPWGESRAGTPAGANVASTAGDQIKWARFHLGDGRSAAGKPVLSEKLLRQMQVPTVETHGVLGDHVGLGWILRDVDGSRVAGHGGTTNGQISALDLVPGRGFAIAVLTNANPNGYPLQQEIVRWALEEYLGVVERDPEPLDLSEERLGAYLGTYETVAAVVHVTVKGGRLMLDIESKDEEQESYPPFPAGILPGDRVIVTDGVAKGMTGFFDRGDSGAIEGLHIGGRLATKVR